MRLPWGASAAKVAVAVTVKPRIPVKSRDNFFIKFCVVSYLIVTPAFSLVPVLF
jgi:hypothetical protein